jgi:peptidoglycan hydrolase-like protein with peptidoglycan-binding domain
LKRDTSERYSSTGATIREIRFDFAEIESLRAKLSKKNDIESKPAKPNNNKISDSNEINENQQKQDDLKQLKAFNRTLNKSIRKYLQYALKHLGYYHGRIDGDFGPKTRQAIKAYQKKEGKAVTGYLDKKAVKKLVQMGKVASENAKKKAVAKTKINKKPVKIEKKNSGKVQAKAKSNDHKQPKKTISAVDQKEKKSESVSKTTSEKESTKQKSKRAEVSKHLNDGIIKTTDELEIRYKSLIDSFNLSMNESFYNQMINAMESCDRAGYYVLGAFISHYLYLRFNDLESMPQEIPNSHRKTKLADHFKNTRNQMIRYYNGSAGNKQALMAVLNKCEVYYQNTETRSLLSKK